MTDGTWQIVGTDYRELQLGSTIGDALRRLVRERFKHHTAKKIEAKWGLDARTARNVVSQGNVSERTLTKAALAERWSLWMALGEELFGQSYAEWEEQRLQKIIEEAERDLDRVRRLRPQASALSERSVAAHAVGSVDAVEEAQPSRGRESRRGVRTASAGDREQDAELTARREARS